MNKLPRNHPILISQYRQLLHQARILDRNPINKCFLIGKPKKVFLRDYEDSLFFRLSSSDLEMIEQLINEQNSGEYYRPSLPHGHSTTISDKIKSIFRYGFPPEYATRIEKSVSKSVLANKASDENAAYLQKCISFGFHTYKRLSGATHLIKQLPQSPQDILKHAFNNPSIENNICPLIPKKEPKMPENSQKNSQTETNETKDTKESTSSSSISPSGRYVRLPLNQQISLNSLKYIDFQENSEMNFVDNKSGNYVKGQRLEKGMLLISHPMSCVSQDELYRKVIYIIEASEDTENGNKDRVVGITLNNAYVMFNKTNGSDISGSEASNSTQTKSKTSSKSRKKGSKARRSRRTSSSSSSSPSLSAASSETKADSEETSPNVSSEETTATATATTTSEESHTEKDKKLEGKETNEDASESKIEIKNDDDDDGDDCFSGWYGEYNYVGGPVADRNYPFCVMHNNVKFYKEFKKSSTVLFKDSNNESNNIYWTWLTYDNHESIFNSLVNVSTQMKLISKQENSNSNSNESAKQQNQNENENENEKGKVIDDYDIAQMYSENKTNKNADNRRPMFKFYQQYTAWNYEQLMIEISNNVWFPAKLEDKTEERNLLMLQCPGHEKEYKRAYNSWMWQYFLKSFGDEYKYLSVFPDFNESLTNEYYDLLHDFHSSWVVDISASEDANDSDGSDGGSSDETEEDEEEDGIGK